MDLMSTAQLLGNFGEFIGGVAVLVTIIYLATQVRHGAEELRANTEQSKTAALKESYGQYQKWTEVFFSDPTFMETWIQGLADPRELPQTDLMKFRTALANHIWLLNSTRQASVASGELTTWTSTLKGASTLFATPGFRAWWELAKEHFPDDFVADVNGADFTLLPAADYSSLTSWLANARGTNSAGRGRVKTSRRVTSCWKTHLRVPSTDSNGGTSSECW